MLRQIRCHTPNCHKTFLAENGRRRFCDACRAAQKERRKEANRKSPAWHEKKNAFQKIYRQRNREKLNAYNALWMRRKRAGLPTAGINPREPAQSPVLEPCARFKRCFQCAFWLKGELKCPRCGSKN